MPGLTRTKARDVADVVPQHKPHRWPHLRVGVWAARPTRQAHQGQCGFPAGSPGSKAGRSRGNTLGHAGGVAAGYVEKKAPAHLPCICTCAPVRTHAGAGSRRGQERFGSRSVLRMLAGRRETGRLKWTGLPEVDPPSPHIVARRWTAAAHFLVCSQRSREGRNLSSDTLSLHCPSRSTEYYSSMGRPVTRGV